MANRKTKEPLEPALRRLIGILLIGLVAVLLDTTVVNVATARLTRELHTSVSVVQWVSTGFLLALGVSIPLTAWAVGRFGGRKVWLVGVALFLLGSVLSGFAWNISSLIAFRVLQGLGGGLMLPVQQTLLVRAAGQARLGRAMAAISLLLAPQGVGSLAARSRVGKLCDQYGPRMIVLAGLVRGGGRGRGAPARAGWAPRRGGRARRRVRRRLLVDDRPHRRGLPARAAPARWEPRRRWRGRLTAGAAAAPPAGRSRRREHSAVSSAALH